MKSAKTEVRNLRKQFSEMTPSEQIKFALDYEVDDDTRDWACYASLVYFMHVHMSSYLRLEFGKHHDQFFKILDDPSRSRKENIIAPRRSAKSSIFVIANVLHKLFFKELAETVGDFAEQYIMIVSRGKRLAMRRLSNIRRIIESSADPRMKGLIRSRHWGKEEFVTTNNTLVLAMSRGGAMRGELHEGFRLTLVICDDADDRESLRNIERVEADWEWFHSDLMPAGDESYTNYFVIDTIKGTEAINNKLRDLTEWNTHFMRAIEEPADLIHPNREDLWQKYQSIWTDKTVEATERRNRADAFYAEHKTQMKKGVVETWKFNREWQYRSLRERGFGAGISVVRREYQNEPENLEDAIFEMDKAIRFEVRDDGFMRSDGRLVRWDDMIGCVSYLDFAGFTEREIRDRCFASVSTVVFEKPKTGGYGNDPLRGEVYSYLVDETLLRGSGDHQFDALCTQFKTWKEKLISRCRYMKFEVGVEFPVDPLGAIRESFSNHYRTVANRMGLEESLSFVRRPANKEVRIGALEAPISNGWLSFHRDMDTEAWKQMNEFPVSVFNDFPDSLEGALSMSISRGKDDAMTVKARKEITKLARQHVGTSISERVLGR